VVGHNLLGEVILLIQHHMADIMMKVTFSADLTGLATAVAGLREGFESLSAVDIHRNARGSAHEGVCIAAGVAAVGGHVSGGRRMECAGERSVSSARVQSEWGDVWRHNGKPHS
jgi:hypothetical protein